MRPMPIRYVRDVYAARHFYKALGLSTDFASRPTRHGPSVWLELQGGPGALALHHIESGESRPVELSFAADEPLEQVTARLSGAGYALAWDIIDEAFGRSFTVEDPEGLLIQINENDHELNG